MRVSCLRVQDDTTMLFLSVRMKKAYPDTPPTEVLAGTFVWMLREVTSGIRSDFWQISLQVRCIYLKPPLIYCPMPLI